jgi:hypothetical protein
MIPVTLKFFRVAIPLEFLLVVTEKFFRNCITDYVDKAKFVELSEDDDFPMEFAMNMGF